MGLNVSCARILKCANIRESFGGGGRVGILPLWNSASLEEVHLQSDMQIWQIMPEQWKVLCCPMAAFIQNRHGHIPPKNLLASLDPPLLASDPGVCSFLARACFLVSHSTESWALQGQPVLCSSRKRGRGHQQLSSTAAGCHAGWGHRPHLTASWDFTHWPAPENAPTVRRCFILSGICSASKFQAGFLVLSFSRSTALQTISCCSSISASGWLLKAGKYATGRGEDTCWDPRKHFVQVKCRV